MIIIRVLKKFGSILSKHQIIRIIELAVLMFIGGILEMCSVSLVIPFMNAMLDPEAFMKKWYAQVICNILKLDSARNLLLVVALGMAAIYILKNAYLLFESNIQYRFVYGNMLSMQRKILANYLKRPYEYYLTVDSGEVLRVVNDDIKEAFMLLMTIIVFLTEFIVSLMLVIAIFIISPFVTIFMAITLLLMILLITSVVRPLLKKAGSTRQKSLAGINKLLIQIIQGIKEIKVTNSEEFFKSSYAKNGRTYVNSMCRYSILGVLPRTIIEAVSMSAMFIVIALMIYGGGNFVAIIPTVSAIAVAALRLLPAANKMSSALGNVAFYEPALDKVIDNIREMDMIASHKMDADSTNKIGTLNDGILMEKATYKYPGSEKNVLDNASMSIKKGQSVGIVGASGAGKTTAVDLLLGLLELNSGSILVDGNNILDDMTGWYELIGYIPQSIFLMDDTIKSNVAFGREISEIDDEQVWNALKDAALDEFVKELPNGIDTVVGERGMRLSGGQRQRIGIARALYRKPQIIIFDEATSALDNETESEIMESINKFRGQKTMIIIAHRLTTIQNCDCVFRVEYGKIVRER